ncbi:serine hydrolase domain-containing protein [Ekhidna sp.]
MKRYLQIVFILNCAIVFANDSGTLSEVWIDGSSFYKSLDHKKKTTLYFNKWTTYTEQFLSDDNYYVALQLGLTLDPLPNDNINLPSLRDLSAIENENVRIDYFRFLESFGRTYGVNHMILPDTAGLSVYEKEIVIQANEHSPYYFLLKSCLTHSLPDSKKEFLVESEIQRTIWIANQNENTKKLNRWSKKAADSKRFTFYSALKKSKQVEFIPAFEFPVSLAKRVFSESVIAIDPSIKFPILEKTVTYLGDDEQLRKRLGQYAKVLNYRRKEITCIVDLRYGERDYFDEDILLLTEAKIKRNSALIFSNLDFAGQDVLIGKMLFGAHGIHGRSDVSDSRKMINPAYLGFADPQFEGMNDSHLLWMDSLASYAIKNFATPGMQLVVVKNGSVVMEKPYGFYTYDSIKPVSNETVYDIASLTKVIGTLPAIALLIDQGKLSLDDSLSQHLDEFRGSNKGGATIRQLMAHNAGLLPYVPFWSMVMDGDRLDAFYYKTPEDEANDVRTYGLEPHPSMVDSLKSFIVRSNLIKDPTEYTYSDLGFMILHLLVEEISEMPFEQYLAENFYLPMKLNHTAFNPKLKGRSFEEIAPTEYDQRYRNYQVWGEVHDRNALVFGGVAGHAGLFSTASDLAKMMSMFLNNGYYGGKQYISKETLSQFNARYFDDNRRGLGWDKKDGKRDSASSLASDLSFGHTGFTGTMVWADPEEDLIFVFLANRIYPDANNWKLGELNTRTNLHDVIYQSLENTN